MRVVILGAAIALAAGAACAQGSHYVRGYTRSNGTYVAPHMQTNPDSTRANNWSTEGNVNPYTGQEGTKPLYPSAPVFGSMPTLPTQRMPTMRQLEPMQPVQPEQTYGYSPDYQSQSDDDN